MRKLDPDRVVEQIALRIAELRRANGMTQDQLATCLRMPLRNLQRIESGSQNLTIRMIVRIAAALGIEPVTLWEPPSPTARRPARGRPRKA